MGLLRDIRTGERTGSGVAGGYAILFWIVAGSGVGGGFGSCLAGGSEAVISALALVGAILGCCIGFLAAFAKIWAAGLLVVVPAILCAAIKILAVWK